MFLWPDALSDANPPPLSRLGTGWEYQKVNPQVNIEKTKVMRSGKSGGEIVKTGRWPCAVCGKGVGANSI